MSMVGLPETAVREAKDRVKAALLNARFDFPHSHITISLAPADLPIALGILAASGQVQDARIGSYEFIGELSLGGELNPVTGVLPAAIRAQETGRGLVIPTANGPECALARGKRNYCAASLLSVVAWLNGRETLPEVEISQCSLAGGEKDLSDVYGQRLPRRALEVAAACGNGDISR